MYGADSRSLTESRPIGDELMSHGNTDDDETTINTAVPDSVFEPSSSAADDFVAAGHPTYVYTHILF